MAITENLFGARRAYRLHKKHPELQQKIPLESVLIHIASPRCRLYQVRVKAQ